MQKEKVKASFFFTGDFYRNKKFNAAIKKLNNNKHYLGAHSDKHLLYCDWNKRDSLLVTKAEFIKDVSGNYKEMDRFDKRLREHRYFMPPYEWYNDSISMWAREMGLQVVNFTPGTLSNADYTTPAMKNYRSSAVIYQSVIDYEQKKTSGLNGFLLLVHLGTDPERTDKFYLELPGLLKYLKAKGYHFQRVDELLAND